MTNKIKQKAKERKNGMLDLMLITVMVLALLSILYFVPKGTFNIYTLSIFLIILIPTIRALVYGAPFVPTPMEAVKKIIKAADIKTGEKVYDIGCGDGRMVYMAAKDYGANAVGFELSPLVYAIARIRHLFWNSKAKVLLRDFKFHNFRDADVIVCYLMPDTLARLQPKLERELKSGARVVSYAFPIGTWKEERQIPRESSKNLAPIWVYEKE